MIGHSHIINARKNYKYIQELDEIDYKIFSQNGEDGIIDYLLFKLNFKKPKFLEIELAIIEANTRFILKVLLQSTIIAV